MHWSWGSLLSFLDRIECTSRSLARRLLLTAQGGEGLSRRGSLSNAATRRIHETHGIGHLAYVVYAHHMGARGRSKAVESDRRLQQSIRVLPVAAAEQLREEA